jgi:signal transduction histidine kinase
MSYGIIVKHGGRIEVHSEIGKGSTFTVCLPISQSNAANKTG